MHQLSLAFHLTSEIEIMRAQMIRLILLSCFSTVCTASQGDEGAILKESTEPNGAFKVEGYWALVIPDIEKSLTNHSKEHFCELLEKVSKNSANDIEELRQKIDSTLPSVAPAWMRFELHSEGNKRRLKYFNVNDGSLLRDVAFDGKSEVQHFADSKSANVFLGRSHIKIRSLDNFYPISRSAVESLSWSQSKDGLKGVSGKIECDVEIKEGLVSRVDFGESMTVLTPSWNTSAPSVRYPIARFRISGRGGSTTSMDFSLVSKIQEVAILTETDLSVPVPKGTTIHRGGLGSPTLGSKKTSRDLVDVARVANVKPLKPGISPAVAVGGILVIIGAVSFYFLNRRN